MPPDLFPWQFSRSSVAGSLLPTSAARIRSYYGSRTGRCLRNAETVDKGGVMFHERVNGIAHVIEEDILATGTNGNGQIKRRPQWGTATSG
jgi:hypothetical protein